MAHRLAPEAETDLDEIWYYVATESGSVDIADRQIDRIAETFYLLSTYPHVGRRRRDEDFAARPAQLSRWELHRPLSRRGW